MSGKMSGETWQNMGIVYIMTMLLELNFLEILKLFYLEDVNYSTEEVNLLLKDILTDVARN